MVISFKGLKDDFAEYRGFTIVNVFGKYHVYDSDGFPRGIFPSSETARAWIDRHHREANGRITMNPRRWGSRAFYQMRRAVSRSAWTKRKAAGGKGVCAWDGKPVYAGGIVREGQLFHKTHYALWKRGITPEQLKNPFALGHHDWSLPNPGPRSRPPAEWFAKMRVRVRANYPYRSEAAIDKITAGIWWNYSDKQRARIGREYERNPMLSKEYGLWNPCPACHNPVLVEPNVLGGNCPHCRNPLLVKNPIALGHHDWAMDNPKRKRVTIEQLLRAGIIP